jgi:uncharacterized protein YndB with AHSA1/START domain
MGHVHTEMRVEAPVQHVFELATKVERISEYNHYLQIRNVSGPIDRVGTTFDSTLKLLGQAQDSKGTIVEVVPNRLIRITGETEAHAKSEWTYRFEPEGEATRCLLDVEYDAPGGVFGAALDRIVFERAFERAMRHMAENFAAMAEMKVPTLA